MKESIGVVCAVAFVLWPAIFAMIDACAWFFSGAHLIHWTPEHVAFSILWPVVFGVVFSISAS